MSITKKYYRFDEIQKIRRGLERGGFPRLQMFLIVMLTGMAGFISSYVLLQSGLTQMWIRYLISIGSAYMVFLLLLWVWLRTRVEDYNDFPDISGFSSSHSQAANFAGNGGGFGGGGASSSFDGPAFNVASPDLTSMSDAGDALSQTVSVAAQADEFALPLVAIVLIGLIAGALLIFTSFIVYSAPELFAELLLDGALSVGLYNRFREIERRHWLTTALNRTLVPFCLVAVFLSAAGFGMSLYAPEANSIGKVILHIKQSHRLEAVQ